MISSEFTTMREMTQSAELEELRLRNEQRLREAKEKMGSRYLLHPSNKVVRQNKEHNFAKIAFV